MNYIKVSGVLIGLILGTILSCTNEKASKKEKGIEEINIADLKNACDCVDASILFLDWMIDFQKRAVKNNKKEDLSSAQQDELREAEYLFKKVRGHCDKFSSKEYKECDRYNEMYDKNFQFVELQKEYSKSGYENMEPSTLFDKIMAINLSSINEPCMCIDTDMMIHHWALKFIEAHNGEFRSDHLPDEASKAIESVQTVRRNLMKFCQKFDDNTLEACAKFEELEDLKESFQKKIERN